MQQDSTADSTYSYQETAATTSATPARKQVIFHGRGDQLFGIEIVNFFLRVITLTLYTPWAKVATRKYIYQQTEFDGSRLVFHGLGSEVFLGYLKAFLLIGLLYAAPFVSVLLQSPLMIFFSFFFVLFGLLCIVPLAIHGTARYRLSRTTWRGIRFGYRGDAFVLIKLFLRGGFYTILSLGIYSSWLRNDMRKYVIDNIRLGSQRLEYVGDGSEMFKLYLRATVIYLFGYFLSSYLQTWLRMSIFNVADEELMDIAQQQGMLQYYIVAFVPFAISLLIVVGILSWFICDYICREKRYYLENICFEIERNGKIELHAIETTFTPAKVFNNYFINALLVIGTLGIATPWATVRHQKFLTENIYIPGEVDLSLAQQTESGEGEATGEGLMNEGMFNLDLDLA